MNVMYHNAIDRLRVMSFLLRSWRYHTLRHSKTKKIKRYSQQELAEKAGYKDGDIISDVENFSHLEEVALEKQQLIARQTLIDVLNKGLERSQKDIDAILWLYLGDRFEPLQKNEISGKHSRKNSPFEIEQANQYTNAIEFNKLRDHVLVLLLKAVKAFIKDPIKKDPKVQMIFELDQPSGLESDVTLYEMERKPGQRLIVTKYPSYLTYPPDIYDYGQWRGSYKLLSEEGKQKRRNITDERRQVFLEHLQLYGERCIHSIESLEKYLNPSFQHRLSYKQRIKQVRHWIKLLEDYDHYEIGLTQVGPEMDIVIKNSIGAFLSGPPGERHWQEKQSKKQITRCGPRYVYWRDDKSVFAFFVDFERQWAAIPETWRDKTTVINWLKEMLPKTP